MSQSPIKKEVTVKLEAQDSLASTKDEWQEIPLKCCNQNELDDVRYHIMRFQSKQDVDIIKDFNKPVRLHRKDPRNIQFQLTREEIDKRKREQAALGIATTEEMIVDSENLDTQDKMDLSRVAPDGGARKVKKNPFKRKTRQINLMDENKRKLRYEEFYPWVIEDYNGLNVYVGNYEAGWSESQHVLFVFDKDGFKVVPAEKVYRFTPRNKYATLTLEEAEAKMEKNTATPRWLMKHMQETSSSEGAAVDVRFRNHGARSATPTNAASRRMRTVTGEGSSNDRDSDHDDIDFEEEFADDEEAPIMDGDEEENKLSERKIKKEMAKAAHFEGQLDVDDDDDLNDLFETEKSRKVDKEGKKLKKFLHKTEGGVYDSDDNDETNPYVSQSDLESNDSDDDDVVVKAEDDAFLGTLRHGGHRVTASYPGDGFVVIRAPPLFLKDFPRGEWSANGRKRAAPVDVSPQKRAKTNSPQAVPSLKRQRSTVSPSPTPNTPISITDLNSSGENNELVTVSEVLNIVKKNPLTTKELLFHLKNRISAHKDNKQRIISIVKQTLKLVDGKLVLKAEQ